MARSNQRQVRRPEDWFPPVRPPGVVTIEVVEAITLLTVIAGEVLGGHRAVFIGEDERAYYADASEATSRLTVGITTSAANEDDEIAIQAVAVLEHLGWSWSGEEPVWLGAEGLLTQTPPTSGYIMQVGIPVGPTQLRINPQFIAFVGG